MNVAIALSGRELSRQLERTDASLVVLDLHHDRDCGLDLLREIRHQSNVPVIMTIADSRTEADCVVGLESGADDCLRRPFGLRELLARIKAVLRRTARLPDVIAEAQAMRYHFEGWQLDTRQRRLLNAAGAAVALTKGEYALLVAFLMAPGRPLTRQYLLQATRVHEDVFDRSIDVQVLRLRRKLAGASHQAVAITTERGVGYRFALDVGQDSERNSAPRSRCLISGFDGRVDPEGLSLPCPYVTALRPCGPVEAFSHHAR